MVQRIEGIIIAIIHNKINNIKKSDFLEFILEKVKLFYITIDKEKATKVFSMMNGQKAIMKTDELIKASLLSKASRQNGKIEQKIKAQTDLDELLQIIKKRIGEEWEVNTLRSKYAREWDKWLYWWNRNDVKTFYKSTNNPLGLLLEYYFELNKKSKDKIYNYKNFNESFFVDVKEVKKHFKKIRDLQKTFEDWFNNYNSYNNLGLILNTTNNRKEALLYFLKELNNSVLLSDYAKKILINATHIEIVEKDEENINVKAKEILNMLSHSYVYWDENNEEYNDGRKEMAFRQLLRMNVDYDNQLERKFDFSIWNNRSLEHIYPKSKKENIKWNDNVSVHSYNTLDSLYQKFGLLSWN